MKDKSFGPRQLLVILLIVLVLMISGLVLGIIFSQNLLSNQALELSKKLDDQAIRQLNPESKKVIQGKLDIQKPYVDTIQSLYASADSAENTLNSNLRKYANKAGIDITSQTVSSSPQKLPNTKSVDIVIRQNTKYSNFMKFLIYVEKSSPKMQVTNLNIKRAASGNADELDITNLTIAIYYR